VIRSQVWVKQRGPNYRREKTGHIHKRVTAPSKREADYLDTVWQGKVADYSKPELWQAVRKEMRESRKLNLTKASGYLSRTS
jgi:hypothetical protein